jgi:HPt (histidine-containing phosphotransfer) domain-containing protein
MARAAHTLKSSAGQIGAEVMHEAASVLERRARAQEREVIPERLRALEEAFARLVPILEQHRKALDTQ